MKPISGARPLAWTSAAGPRLDGYHVTLTSLDPNLTWTQALDRLQLGTGQRAVAAVHRDRLLVVPRRMAEETPLGALAAAAEQLSLELARQQSPALTWKITVVRATDLNATPVQAQVTLLEQRATVGSVELAARIKDGSILTDGNEVMRVFSDGRTQTRGRRELTHDVLTAARRGGQ